MPSQHITCGKLAKLLLEHPDLPVYFSPTLDSENGCAPLVKEAQVGTTLGGQRVMVIALDDLDRIFLPECELKRAKNKK